MGVVPIMGHLSLQAVAGVGREQLLPEQDEAEVVEPALRLLHHLLDPLPARAARVRARAGLLLVDGDVRRRRERAVALEAVAEPPVRRHVVEGALGHRLELREVQHAVAVAVAECEEGQRRPHFLAVAAEDLEAGVRQREARRRV
jgi:hypothetical protein